MNWLSSGRLWIELSSHWSASWSLSNCSLKLMQSHLFAVRLIDKVGKVAHWPCWILSWACLLHPILHYAILSPIWWSESPFLLKRRVITVPIIEEVVLDRLGWTLNLVLILWLQSVLVQSNLSHIGTLSSKHELLSQQVFLSLLNWWHVRNCHSLLFLKLFDSISVSERIQGMFTTWIGRRHVCYHCGLAVPCERIL